MTAERAGAVVGPTDWIDNEGMRMALALERIALSTERIAVALEQAALERVPSGTATANEPQWPVLTGSTWVPDQLPPPPLAAVSVAPSGPSAAFRESRDLPAQPFVPMQPNWQAGMVHQNGHKPLKVNSKGLFCPTKMDNGDWCNWKPR